MATISSNLYPPIMPDTLPAFVGGPHTSCTIYFEISKYDSANSIQNVQVSLINQKTNASVLNSPSGIIIAELNTQSAIYNKYSITIRSQDILNQTFETNEYYKIQLRFTTNGASTPELLSNNNRKISPRAVSARWLEQNKSYFSEWSKVCLIKSISQPILVLKGFQNNVSENQVRTLSSELVELAGKLENLNAGEYLRSYNIKIYLANEEDQLVMDSGDIYVNEYRPNEINYQLTQRLNDGLTYKIVFSYVTNNLYSSSYSYLIRIIQHGLPALECSIDATPDNENGRIKVSITLDDNSKYLRNVTIRRTSSKSNFHTWEDIKTIPSTNSTGGFVWYDNTVESGVYYKYCAQQRNSRGDRGAIDNITTAAMVLFDDMFLISETNQLKIRFNPTLSDFKYNVTESQQIGIGAKYPFIKRNSNNYFRSFQIGGLISSLIDTDYYNSYFGQYTYHDKLGHTNKVANNDIQAFTSREQIYQEAKIEYDSKYNIDYRVSNDRDYIYEKEFRQKVYDFLYEHNVKLFKSTTEGNILVKLTNISFQPMASLGRLLYSFTATATEVDEANILNYDKYNIIKIGTYDTEVVNQMKVLGQLQLQNYNNPSQNIVQDKLKETYYNKSKNGYINKLSHLTFLRIEITSPPHPINKNNKTYITRMADADSNNVIFGYLAIINNTTIIIPSSQRLVQKKEIFDDQERIISVPQRFGFFELGAEDVSVTDLYFPSPGGSGLDITIDYVASIAEYEDTSKIPMDIIYFNNPGQLYGSFWPQELLISKINSKYFLNSKTNFQYIMAIDGIRLEGPIGAVAYVKDSKDSDYSRHVLQDGYLQLMENDISIKELYFRGIHLTPKNISDNWYKKSTTVLPSKEDDFLRDSTEYTGFPTENLNSQTIYKVKRTKEVYAVLYNEWFNANNPNSLILSEGNKKSYRKNSDINYSLILDPTQKVIDENFVDMVYIYGSWYSLDFYLNNITKFTQLAKSDIRHIKENQYVYKGIATSLNQIENPRNHQVYKIPDEQTGARFIYHNEQWYPFSDEDDILCPVDGIVNYFYELARGRYNNEI